MNRARMRIRETLPVVEASARAMRRTLTPAERVIWAAIRKPPLDDWKWRRQHPVGRFVLDFCCPQLRLVVELDGHVHATTASYDEARTAQLTIHGYHVVRFSNRDVFERLDAVLATIARECDARRLLSSANQPPPPPNLGEGVGG
ncbi:MAG: DUF559 domain-containing protein [Ardenticatenales bacterium]